MTSIILVIALLNAVVSAGIFFVVTILLRANNSSWRKTLLVFFLVYLLIGVVQIILAFANNEVQFSPIFGVVSFWASVLILKKMFNLPINKWMANSIVSFVVLVLFSTYIGSNFARPFVAVSDSMFPSVKKGEYGFLKKNFGELKHLSIVMYLTENDGHSLSIGRILGIPGDTILFRNGIAYLGEESSHLSKTPSIKSAVIDNNMTKLLNIDEYFIVTDNEDSNYVATTTRKDRIIGEVWFHF